ncbi:long-chain acyl-CoA synthetase [Microbacterium endophyticum]|uniref:Acyl-CoA synthetase n=1 Tax=Microbacterium endophyticum TaxID=1526412 RepID=A0A7W4YMW4_9MICO|nr:AMP-dependent synthetase/ligase [Microbacterium endophyticum]MBB2975939.1 long-chain acyl-CoA synthetase [Microbacterium endophyticum]NIK37692.1 long-chain acyl-CoA synthetase [Microbacterium endophyticum]
MQESSTQLRVYLDSYRNVTDLLVRRASDAPEHAAFDVPAEKPGTWQQVTTEQFLDDVKVLAKGLIAADIAAGDTVAIMAPSRYEWAVADLAIWFAGGVVVPIYDTSSPVQVSAIVADAHVRLAVAGSATQAETLRSAFDETGAGALGVWVMDAAATGGETYTLAKLTARGNRVSDADLEHRRQSASLDDTATIVYTSGTTGEPKGAILTHRNFLGQVLNIAAAYREVVHPGGNTIIFLPLAHVLARGLQLICLASGMRIAHISDPKAVITNLPVLRPTFLVVVPRVLQKIRAAASAKAAGAGLSRMWDAASATAVEWGNHSEDRTAARASIGLRVKRACYDALFFRRLRAVMGGRVNYVLSGGAALEADLSLFFRGIGVPVIEGYGLTETTAPLTGNLPGNIRSGTVGLPLPGSTIRISAEGEILARGVGVFNGYRNPRHNEGAFVDGFFRTGDLGSLDADGRLVLCGRVKDVIVTSGGKTIVPMPWETTVEKSPLVSHAVMVGEGRSFLSALILLDPDETKAWALAEGITIEEPTGPDLTRVVDSRLRSHVQRVVNAANVRVAHSEQVRRFTLLSTDLGDSSLITPTLKIKRQVILERGSAVVDDLYR